MKKSLILLFLAGLILAGCGPMTPQQQQAYQNFWQEYSNVYQRQLDRDAYGYQPTIIRHQNNSNSNYWQERYYQQKVNQYKNPMDGIGMKYNPYTGGY